ncbi:Fatty acid synthase [Frankliniella fusca]|uniref:Fatty acid synthase n=1 Tax=Frankliniella fusca TaxID=407009 RepID=A0AAE1L9D2_9NEOP|nr:Fatty acid synthase [Frankliniella fusca]
MTEVVISGIGGLFPNSGDLETLGRNILANEYLVQRHEDLWQRDERIPLEPIGGRMPHHDRFDNSFFGMTRKLSKWVDPLAKLGYERCFEAIMDAGINPASLRGSNTHVYAGTNLDDLGAVALNWMRWSDGYAIMGNNRAMNSNRVSYYFDFHGKSCAYDMADAFGQLGLGMATEAISSGETDAVLVVAATTVAYPNICQMYRDMGVLSRDTLCHPFEEEASGTHRSDCCVAFLLQRADLAKRAYCRVVASEATHLGARLRFDPTLPSPAGVRAFLGDLYRRSGVDPRRVAYVEGDGAGSHLLDALELDSLDAALGRHREQPLLVGCVKSNAGHTEVACGMLGIAKCVVAMETGVIPATINHVRDVRCDALDSGRLQLVTENTPMAFDRHTYVGVSSYSMTGSFGHAILAPHAGPKRAVDPAAELPRLVVVSARSEEAAVRVAEKTHQLPLLNSTSPPPLPQVRSYSFDPEYLRLVQDVFGPGIRGYEYRSFVICPPEANEVVKVARVERRTVWFVYSGMGSQWAGMGAALLAVPVFAETIDRLQAVLEPRGLDLRAILTETGPAAFDSIMKSFVGITACQIALTNVLFAVGLRPDGIIGHSVGELGCAYADGCLTEEQALLAAWARGRASTEATLIKGMMAAIGLGYREVLPRLPPGVEVACHNSSTSCTLSGPAEAVEAFVAQLSAEGVFARAVNVSDIAYHSTYIQPAAPHLREYLRAVIPEPKKRSSKWVTTSVPEHLRDEDWAAYCSAEYQTNNLLSPVLFEEGLAFVPSQAALLEVAPHGLLQAILRRAKPDNVHIALTQRAHPDPVRFLLAALGTASFHVPEVDAAALYPPVSFPVSRGTPTVAPLVSWTHDEVLYHGFNFCPVRRDANVFEFTAQSPCMAVYGTKVLPPSEALEAAWRALGNFESSPVSFRDLRIRKYDRLPEAVHTDLTEVVTAVSEGTGTFEVRDQESDHLFLTGTVKHLTPDDADVPRAPPPAPPAARSAPAVAVESIILTGEEVRADLAAKGLVLHDKYGALLWVRVDEHEWTVAVDGNSPFAAILQALLLVQEYRASEETVGLVLARRWQRLDVDPVKLRAQSVVLVRYILKTGDMFGDGLYAAGFSGAAVAPKTKASAPSPLSYTFVAYRDTKLQNVGEFLSLAVQLMAEGEAPKRRGAPTVCVLELQNCSGPNVLGPAVRAVLLERLGVRAVVRTVSVRPGQPLELPDKKEDTVFLTVSAPTTMTEAARVAAHVGGLLLTRTAARLQDAADLAVVADQLHDGGWLSLLRAPAPAGDAVVLNMALDQAPPRRAPEANGPVVLVWRGEPAAGVRAVVDEARRRTYAHRVRLVFLLDEGAPEFSPAEQLYSRQLRLQLQVNVLRAGRWGCWHAIPLEAVPAAVCATSLGDVAVEAYGLNPRAQDQQGGGDGSWVGHLDYLGVSGKGGRVMGVARWLSGGSGPEQDPLLRWAVPDGWGAAEAVTVPFAYATVYHALLVTARLRRGDSVLVHGGASALGQAAIRVALQLGAPAAAVFTTVATEAQRQLVCRLFPQLGPRNVLSCADGSTAFEWHIRALTRQRGVDVVLNTLPGEQFLASLRCIRRYGRMLHCGREDTLPSKKLAMGVFLSSVAVYGFTGDQLFLASECDRRAVHRAVQRGLEAGVVRPVQGARAFSAAAAASARDALRADDVAKVVLVVKTNSVSRDPAAAAGGSFVVVGGGQDELLQVAGWLSQHGAREVLAVPEPSPAPRSSLLRHRQRALLRLFGTNLRVEEVASWDEATARRVLQVTDGPVHSVIVIAKGDGRVAALLHAALGLRPCSPGLVVLCARADTACALSSLCEARRAAGLRAACLSGPLARAAPHLPDLLAGARPPVTLLDGAEQAEQADGLEAAPRGVPAGAGAVAELGRRLAAAAARGPSTRLREVPSLGLRARHAREALPVYAVAPLGALTAEDGDDLAALALRVLNPVVVVEAGACDDLTQQAGRAARAIEAARPAGPYNVLGWGVGTPLALEVARILEGRGHNAVTFLVDGHVRRVRAWASRQTDLSLLKTVFTDDKSQEVLESDVDVADLLQSVLVSGAVSESECPRAAVGFLALRKAVTALAGHEPRVDEPVAGRLIEIQGEARCGHCFSRGPKVSLRTMPRAGAVPVLRSSWLADVLMEHSGVSKEARQEELRPLLLALRA